MHAGEEVAEAGGGGEDQRQQGPQGEREKDLWAGMLSRKPLWIPWPVMWEGTLRPPCALGILAPGRRLTDPTCSDGHLLWGGFRGQVGHLLWRWDCAQEGQREKMW